MELRNDNCIVNISIDPTYSVRSADNKRYDIELNPDNLTRSDYYKALTIHIDLFVNTINIVLVGSYFSYDYDCAVLDGDILTVMQNDTFSQINIFNGSLLLHQKYDCCGSNFCFYKVSQGYLVYGEQEIVMLDGNFNKLWSFSGRDIFVTQSDKPAFTLCDNSIRLYDWLDNYYELDFNGNLISTIDQGGQSE